MKKFLLLVSILFVTSACTNINKIDYKDNINSVIKDNYNKKIYNHSGNGYKYYLPKYMSIKNVINYNETINSNDYTYYLYLDVISYFNNKDILNNKKCSDSYEFKYKDLSGYLCINDVNDKKLVEIVYNYAKIEVIVEEMDLSEVINNSIIILSTINYDKDLIDNLLGENKINSSEENLSIFDNNKNKDDFLEVVEEYDKYYEKDDKLPDYDVIN